MDWHCPEYEELTIEEKLLVDAEMREWFKNSNPSELCMPTFMFKLTEERIIEEFKRKEKHDKRNRKPSIGRTNS